MNDNIKKRKLIDSIDEIYSLGIMKFKSSNNNVLKSLLSLLEQYEDKIELCTDYKSCLRYKLDIDNIIKQIEVIVNE